MTAVPAPDVRSCRLYYIYVWDPRTNYTTKILGYVGETVRQPIERLGEHIESQPWSDTIVAWVVGDDVYAGKPTVLRAEAAAIRAERPLYNVKQNERNADRITPPDAIRQRRARDAAAGCPPWVHPDDRSAASRRTPAPSSQRKRELSPRWRAFRNRAAGWSAAWATLTGGGWFGLHRYAPLPDWRAEAVAAGVAALGLLVWAWRRFRPRRRRRRR